MGQIRVLPDQLINQIAAGEVIERPASIVKELLENAIDAESTHITVEIMKGGTEKIVVTDDGCGMDEMDARMAFERHATSKVASLEDLEQIKTLGFRGEALASIASVSELTLQTKTANALGGVRLEMEGGKDPVVTASGCSVGTKIEVSNLFFNTPARKKYLKQEQTEYRHILEAVQDAALAHPKLAFKFVSNGRTIFDLLATEKLMARIGALFGKAVSDEMVDVFYGGADIQIAGYVGKPQTARATRKYQYFIINGRPVQDNRLSYAVKEGFSNLIPGTQHPVFVLSITIDPSQVDVNVHPRKLEVRFSDPNGVFRIIKSSVNAALNREHLMHNVPIREQNLDQPAFMRKEEIKPVEKTSAEIEEEGAEYDPSIQETASSMWGAGTTPSSSGAQTNVFGAPITEGSTSGTLESMDSDSLAARRAYLLKKRAERMAAREDSVPETSTPSSSASSASASSGGFGAMFGGAPSSTPSPTPEPNYAEPEPTPSYEEPTVTPVDSVATFTEDYSETRVQGNLRPVAQIKNSYIVAQDDEGIVLIDQHAAHERVMLAKFQSNEEDREPARQPLLTPHSLELDHREKAVLEEHLELLESLGFEISAFGGNTYHVDSVPDFLANEDLDEVMKGFLDDLLNDQPPREAARRHEHILHTLACRAAIKFNRRLSKYEQTALIKSLMETEGSCACAHGRPTMIRMTFEELERKFGRS